jgi:hypothetical protein
VTNQTDETASRLASLRSSWERVAGTVALSLSGHEAIESMTTRIDSMGHDLAAVRSRGYRYGRDWETQMDTIRRRWTQQRGQVPAATAAGATRAGVCSARSGDDAPTGQPRHNLDKYGRNSRFQDLESNVRQAEIRVQQTFAGSPPRQAASLAVH